MKALESAKDERKKAIQDSAKTEGAQDGETN